MRLARWLIALALLLVTAPVLAQSTVLNAGPSVAGHLPQYVNSGSAAQTVIQDSGTAAGGPTGTNAKELGLTVRGTGTAPYANAGTGPNGENFCDYDAPTNNPGGYHYLCLSPNAQGGGLIDYGHAGAAPALPLQIIENGSPAHGIGSVTSVTCGTGLTGGTITTSGTCALANPVSPTLGGTGAASVPAARAAGGLNVESYKGVGNATYQILVTDHVVGTTTSLTTTRTWTLPAASGVNPGQQIEVADFASAVNGTNFLVVQRAGGDTINGGSNVTITTANGAYLFASDGVSKWTGQSVGAASGGGVTSITAGSGLTGGVITTSGTIALATPFVSVATSYFVGSDIPAPSISISSPAVVTSTAHGLTTNSSVVFNVPQNTKAVTITEANPAVVTLNAHGYSAGRPIKFASTGKLPAGIASGTTYYVIAAGLATNTFEISATPGGAAIDTTAPSFTVTIANPAVFTQTSHGYAQGQAVKFATSGALPTGLAAGTTYYVLQTGLTGSAFEVSTVPGGVAVSTTGTQSGTQTSVQVGTHYGTTTGALPTGVTEGTAYFVIAAGLTANQFEFSATLGGSAINTTGSVTGSPVYNAYTGSDSNDGTAATVGNAFLTIQKGFTTVRAAINPSGATQTVRLADGVYTVGASITGPGNTVTLTGNSTAPSNTLVTVASAGFTVSDGARANFSNLKMTSGNYVLLANTLGAITTSGTIEVGSTAFAINAQNQGRISMTGTLQMTGSTAQFIGAGTLGQVQIADAVSIIGLPSASIAFVAANNNAMEDWTGATLTGNFTGRRFLMTNGGIVNTNNGGYSYFPGTIGGNNQLGIYH